MKKYVLIITVIALAVFSCAKTSDDNFYQMEMESFEAWMKKHVDLTNPDIEKLDNGMYIEWIERSGSSRKLETGDYFYYNYSGYTIEDNYLFMTRNAEKARIAGSFTRYTHYVPELFSYSSTSGLTAGERAALALMSEGDSVRIYLPSQLAFGGSTPSYSHGYEGQPEYTITANSNVKVEMRITAITADITDYEQRLVREFATTRWGMAAGDTIKPNFYLETFWDDSQAGDTIYRDSVNYIFFVGKFLDGFIFDTNVEQVGRENYDDNSIKYSATSYTPNSTSGSLIDAFYYAFQSGELRYGSWARMAVSSDYAYSSSGKTSNTLPSSVIQPHEPLTFEIYVAPLGYDPDDGQDFLRYPFGPSPQE